MNNKVKCKDCGYKEEFEDDGMTVDCMPDGCLVENGEWICSDCVDIRGLMGKDSSMEV